MARIRDDVQPAFKPPVVVELTHAEAVALRDLLYRGIDARMLDKENLNLRELMILLQTALPDGAAHDFSMRGQRIR